LGHLPNWRACCLGAIAASSFCAFFAGCKSKGDVERRGLDESKVDARSADAAEPALPPFESLPLPKLLWTVQGVTLKHRSPPAVLDGRLFGYAKSNVVALDLRTGWEIWRRRVPSEVFPELIASAGRVFVNDSVAIHALTAESGRPLWTHRCACGRGCWFGAFGGDSTATCALAGRQRTEGLAAKSGKLRWTRTIGASRRSRPAIDSSRAYFIVDQGEVDDGTQGPTDCLGLRDRPGLPCVALELATGKQVWESRCQPGYSDLAVGEGILLAPHRGVRALRATDGLAVWSMDPPRWPGALIEIDGGLVVGPGSVVLVGEGGLERRGLADGEMLATYRIPGLEEMGPLPSATAIEKRADDASARLRRAGQYHGRAWASEKLVVVALSRESGTTVRSGYVFVWSDAGRCALRWPGGGAHEASVVGNLLLVSEESTLRGYSLVELQGSGDSHTGR
jgi:outer membrane protein assembly factor BamB